MSADDRLLETLGALAREQESEAAPAELLRPLDPERRERLVDQTLAGLAATPGERTSPRSPAEVGPPTPIRRRLGRWLAGFTVPLAVTAGVLLWLRAPALPSYLAAVTGGVAELRGPPAASDPLTPVRLAPGAPLEIVLRPETAVRGGSPEARVFFVRDDRFAPWRPAIADHAASGAFLFRGLVESPFGPGPGEMVMVVAPAGALAAVVDAKLLRTPPARWRVVRQSVRWQ
jgi:hypothetical protein